MANFSSPVQIGVGSWNVLGTGISATTAATDSTGFLYTWGLNSAGQIGDISTTNRSSPVLISQDLGVVTYPAQVGSSSWTAISAGTTHTMAIRKDSALFGWGLNANGQLSTGTTVNQVSPVQIGSSSWVAVSAGNNFTEALFYQNVLYAWGLGTSGRLGNSSTLNRSSPVLVTTSLNTATNSPVQLGWSSWSVIGAGAQHTLATKQDYSLWTWGRNQYYQLGDTTTFNRSSPVQIGSSSWTAVAGGNRMSGAIRAGGALFSWGNNTYGQLGQQFTFIAAGGYTVNAAIRSDGALFTWGRNNQGQLGINNNNSSNSPIQVGSSQWTMIAINNYNAVAIRKDGGLFTWGAAGAMLGGTGTVARSSPVQIGSSSWTAVASGMGGAAAIRTDGALFLWGGVGGLGGSSPTQLGSSSWTAVSVGSYIAAAIRTDGALFAWGTNKYGQIGDGTTITKNSPVQIGSSSWIAVSASGTNGATLAIRADGALFAWGFNGNGQVGDNTITNKSSPVQIGSNSWIAVASNKGNASTGGSFAVSSDGLLFGWGRNSNSSLGLNNTISRSSPTQIGSSSWTAVAAQTEGAVATLIDGTIWAWGQNGWGELGISSTVARTSSPVLVFSLAGSANPVSSPVQVGTGLWNKLTMGGNSGAALDNNNLLYTWGLNSSGQIGDNTSISRSSPTQIGSSSWTVISAGQIDIYGIKKS